MRRSRGQALILFAIMLPTLLGFLGLAIDGGQYFALRWAAQIAASSAARAAAYDVQAGRYATTDATGRTVGLRNLDGLRLSDPALTLAYNDTPNAAPSAAGWYSTAPRASTTSTRATVTARYDTVLLPLVGVRTVGLERTAVVSLSGGELPPAVVPLALCQQVSTEMDARPGEPQIVWRLKTNTCGLPKWDGLLAIAGRDNCKDYEDLFLPQPGGVPPAIGTTWPLSTKNCANIDRWLDDYDDRTFWVAVVTPDEVGGTGTIACYRQIRFTVGRNQVDGMPVASSPPCGIREVY